MQTNAIATANCLIDIAESDGKKLKQFGLIKRVYIVHGFALILFENKGKGALDPRFDTVEAWKHGPVIPSVYHSFKHFGDSPVEKSFIVEDVDKNGSLKYVTPMLSDPDIVEACRIVWKRYINYNDFEIIRLLHREGTPWSLCYREGENRQIPDIYTKAYYRKLITRLYREQFAI
ncbi:MAG: DUF4065 domain-containing protein [Prevotellaceae bacterium]|nr:DUF4065 domain-containing protein [Prevotellaceae bacterium]